jgi:hypothetical protein
LPIVAAGVLGNPDLDRNTAPPILQIVFELRAENRIVIGGIPGRSYLRMTEPIVRLSSILAEERTEDGMAFKRRRSTAFPALKIEERRFRGMWMKYNRAPEDEEDI